MKEFSSLCKISGSGYFSATLVHHEVHGLEKLLGLLSGLGEVMSCVGVLLNRGQKKRATFHRAENNDKP